MSTEIGERKGTERERRLLRYVESPEFAGLRSATDRYLALLAFICAEQPAAFAEYAKSFQKLSRIYFATTSDEIRQSGRSTQPQPIGNSGFWALTNMRAALKRQIATDLAIALGYPRDIASEATATVAV